MTIGSSLDAASSRPSRQKRQRGRGLSKESHVPMMAISNSNLPTPSQQLFSCPQRCSTQQQGPHGPWLMHLEMALQDTKELCQCSPPPAAQINVPHPGRPYHGTRPRTYPNVRSGDAACRARFQLIDMPTRLCGQEQASGACSKLAAKKEETSSGQWSSLVTRDGPPQVTGSPDLPRATVLPPSATTAWSQGTTASQIVSGTAAQRAAACPVLPQAREHSVRPETHDISTTTVIRHGGQR